MNREGHNNVTFFVGTECEHTMAFGKKTLFVVGKQPLATIESIAKTHKTPHIFMGANHSFDVEHEVKDTYWKETITRLLDQGFYVSLDYPAHLHSLVLPMFSKGVWQCRTFIPMLRVCIPNLEDSNPNLTVKIDDVDFASTNQGVWAWHFHELTDSNKFTGWGDYGTDVVIQKAVSTDVGDMPVKEAAKPVKEPHKKNNNVVIDTNPMGLDADSPSKLKPDVDPIVSVFAPKSVETVADAYAEGETEDVTTKLTKKAKAKKAE